MLYLIGIMRFVRVLCMHSELLPLITHKSLTVIMCRGFSELTISGGFDKYFRRISSIKKLNDTFNINKLQLCSTSNYNNADMKIYLNVPDSEEKLINHANSSENLTLAKSILKEVFEYRFGRVSSWIIESKIKSLCSIYGFLSEPCRKLFIEFLAKSYVVNHKEIFEVAKLLLKAENESDLKIMRTEDQLRNILTPQYLWLFQHIGKVEKGVKFLVDFRTDVLKLVAEKNAKSGQVLELQQLNLTLRDLLSMWFSVGFLKLERITWKSSCEMLQKISEYEAVHPVRSWTDLKKRVGPYRRCFIYLHHSMPNEPVVVLHTVLSDEISNSMMGIIAACSRMSDENTEAGKVFNPLEEDPERIKAAVFYSISSTQKGLQGIELGNYLIKRVILELQNEFPSMNKFSSLSPIPLFRIWLIERLKNAEKGQNDIFFKEEIEILKAKFSFSCEREFFVHLKGLIFTNRWIEDPDLIDLLEKPLMRLCARYLYLEKHRGYALDSVANFHLRNGAVMWRLNWRACLSVRGLSNSCGIMVNYRYFLEDTETRSREYLEKQKIHASEKIIKMADQAQKLKI